LIDVGWTVGPLLVFLGAWIARESARAEDRHAAHGRFLLLLPYFPALIALTVATDVALSTGRLEGFLVWNGLGIVAALFARQLVAMLDNVSLARNLEIRVRDRTAELSASEERFRSLVQNTSDVIAVISPQTVLSYAAGSVERYLGAAPASLVGSDLLRFVHAEDQPRFQASIAEAINHPRAPVAVECRVSGKNGNWSSLEFLITNLLSEPSVAGIVLNARDVTERKRLENQLSHQAFHDPLTGLANRALFQDRVEHALRRSRRLNEPLAVLFMDLDGFKAVNDSAGHAAGDELLHEFAERLTGWARPGDTVARLGGDEFAVLIEGLVEPKEAESFARRVIERSRDPYLREGRKLLVGISIGIAVRSDPEDTADVLLRNADVAMYIAKARGKGRYETFSPDMHAPIIASLETEAELRVAIEHGDLVVHYQPIVEFPSERVVALEALVRWEHPERGLIPPDDFIPVAERSGLIHQIGEFVLDEACRAIRSLPPGPEGPMHVTVNLSAAQFESPDLSQIVAAALKRSDLAPELLVLEITETTVMSDTELTVRRLKALKKLGVRLAIDDFGTGYSSLSYLRRFPVDVLKIDRSFVRNIDESPEESALAQAILKLAQTFKLEAVAEGIERREQLDTLANMGCRFGQGFYFARPQTLEGLRGLLGSDTPADAVHEQTTS
jgi:diguanylate cyclase (GGDEF)-like protein/PAS domain S-box-containing protein